MIRAVLLDLDDTLLRNDMAGFLPTYLRSLGEALADLVDPGRLAAEVMAGTRDMLVNQDPRRTLADCFAARFYPALGWNEPDMRPRLQDYYSRVFPQLQTLTAPMPGAVELVEALQQAGLELAIATNPLFPRLAVEHRLYPRALALFASGGISIADEKVRGPQVLVNQEKVLIWPPLD